MWGRKSGYSQGIYCAFLKRWYWYKGVYAVSKAYRSVFKKGNILSSVDTQFSHTVLQGYGLYIQ